MTALFNALDNYTPSQVGENGHSEFTWSNGTRERILQLSFQLTRCKDDKQIQNLMEKYNISDKTMFPAISRMDPVARILCLKPGQLLHCICPSKTAITSNYYRICV